MRLTAEYPTEIRKGKDPDKWQEGSQKSKASVELAADGDAGLSFEFRPLAPGAYRLQLEAEDVAARYGSPVEVVLKIGK